jgi:hypothetical protein
VQNLVDEQVHFTWAKVVRQRRPYRQHFLFGDHRYRDNTWTPGFEHRRIDKSSHIRPNIANKSIVLRNIVQFPFISSKSEDQAHAGKFYGMP